MDGWNVRSAIGVGAVNSLIDGVALGRHRLALVGPGLFDSLAERRLPGGVGHAGFGLVCGGDPRRCGSVGGAAASLWSSVLLPAQARPARAMVSSAARAGDGIRMDLSEVGVCVRLVGC